MGSCPAAWATAPMTTAPRKLVSRVITGKDHGAAIRLSRYLPTAPRPPPRATNKQLDHMAQGSSRSKIRSTSLVPPSPENMVGRYPT